MERLPTVPWLLLLIRNNSAVNHTGLWQPAGEFKFDATNAIKALALIGKHVDVTVFEAKVASNSLSEEMVEQLQRGRLRAVKHHPPVSFL